MIRVVGNLQNDEWQERWEHMRLNSECTLKTLEGKLKSLPTSTPYLLKALLILLEDGELPLLESPFNTREHDKNLLPVMSVIRGLMRYQPSSRITASEALDILGK